ncbi:MAG: hypothetical protein GY711_13255 [bacterium]|nr:hypothetical protein [bacterium]
MGDSAQPARRSPWLAGSLVLAVAFAARLAALVVLDDPCGIEGKETSWDWGYEQAAIGQALARGEGFSDAFAKGTGSTGWSAPTFPALLALLIAIFDEIGRPLATALAVIQALVSAATCLALLALGRALLGPRLGLLSAWAWALHPGAIYYSVSLPWDSTFAACGITWFLAALAGRGSAVGAGGAARLGVGFGALLLVNPAPIALLPGVLVYWVRGQGLAAACRTAAAFGAAALIVASPWMARNALVLGSPGIRTNLGVELMVGNNDTAEGQFNGAVHPAYNAQELARYSALGEHAYAAECSARFRAWARANPGRFIELCGVRCARFWFGRSPFQGIPLGDGSRRARDWMGWIKWSLHAAIGLLALAGALLIRGGRPEVGLVRSVLVLFPLVYFVTHVFERYRLPIEPVMVLACVWGVLALVGGRRSVA